MSRQISITPRYEHLRAFITQIPAIMDEQGTYIYGGRRNLIKRFEAPDGTVVNVKRFKKPNFLNSFVYSTGIRKPKGIRAFTYPERLLAKGIETPEAIAYIEERNAIGLLQESWFVSLQCPYRHLLYELGDATPEVYEPIAKALAGYAAFMHGHEVLHLDFSPGNIRMRMARITSRLSTSTVCASAWWIWRAGVRASVAYGVPSALSSSSSRHTPRHDISTLPPVSTSP